MRRCTQQMKAATALAVALGAVIPSAASAESNSQIARDRSETAQNRSGPPIPTVTTPEGSGSAGFDWADASIGAGAGLAFSLIVVGGRIAVLGPQRGRVA
jgi:hypothetical protein